MKTQARNNPLQPLLDTFTYHREKSKEDVSKLFELATVTNADGAGGFQLQLDKEGTSTVKFYRSLEPDVNVGDRVLLARISSSFVIVGVASGDTGWMTDQNTVGLISPYNGNFTVQSYAIRKIRKRVEFTAAVQTAAAVGATWNLFTTWAYLDPSLTADTVKDWPFTTTGNAPTAFFEVSGQYLIMTGNPAAIAANSVLYLSGSYRCP